MSRISVVVGAPCAGKSTYVREASAAGDVCVDFDRLAEALGSQAPHAASGAIRQAAFTARAAVIDQVLQGIGQNAWIIHTNPSKSQIASYQAAGAQFILLDPGEAVCLQRAEADGRPGPTAAAISAWYATIRHSSALEEIEQIEFLQKLINLF